LTLRANFRVTKICKKRNQKSGNPNLINNRFCANLTGSKPRDCLNQLWWRLAVIVGE
jgi:hypothetical protein